MMEEKEQKEKDILNYKFKAAEIGVEITQPKYNSMLNY